MNRCTFVMQTTTTPEKKTSGVSCYAVLCGFSGQERALTTRESLCLQGGDCLYDHEDFASYKKEENAGYFEKPYQAKNPLYPRICTGCAVTFGSEDYPLKGKDKKAVYLCHNGGNSHHKCMVAYCEPCIHEETETKRRAKRKTAKGALYDSGKKARHR